MEEAGKIDYIEIHPFLKFLHRAAPSPFGGSGKTAWADKLQDLGYIRTRFEAHTFTSFVTNVQLPGMALCIPV